MSDNPFVKPGSCKVDEYFQWPEAMMPFLGKPFRDAEHMRQSFDEPERLEIINVRGTECLRLKRD